MLLVKQPKAKEKEFLGINRNLLTAWSLKKLTLTD